MSRPYTPPAGSPATWSPDEVVLDSLVRAMTTAEGNLPQMAGMRYNSCWPPSWDPDSYPGPYAEGPTRESTITLAIPGAEPGQYTEVEVEITQRSLRLPLGAAKIIEERAHRFGVVPAAAG